MARRQDLDRAQPAVHYPAARAAHHEPVLCLVLNAVVLWLTWQQLFFLHAEPWVRDAGRVLDVRAGLARGPAQPDLESWVQPYWGLGSRNVWWSFRRADGESAALAGLYGEWTDPGAGELVLNYTMITQPADAHAVLSMMHRPGKEKRGGGDAGAG